MAGTKIPDFGLGVTDGSSAAAGEIGEVIEDFTTDTVNLNSPSYKSISSITLTAGSWLISASGNIEGKAGTAVTQMSLNINTTADSGAGVSNGKSQGNFFDIANPINSGENYAYPSVGPLLVNISGSTTYYANVFTLGGTGTATEANVYIMAVRIR